MYQNSVIQLSKICFSPSLKADPSVTFEGGVFDELADVVLGFGPCVILGNKNVIHWVALLCQLA